MDFVTKKQFEDAVKVIEKAIANSQLTYQVLNCDPQIFIGLTDIAFSSGPGCQVYGSKHITFVSQDQAAKNKLHSLREKLKIARKDVGENQKVLEKLEAEEKALAALLPALKE